MAVAFYMDVHVPWAITEQLRRRGVDVITAIEDQCDELPDDELLERATTLDRVMVTQDKLFRVMAEHWIRDGRPFAGLLYGPQMGATLGQWGRLLACRVCI